MLTSSSYAELIPLSDSEKEAVRRQTDRLLASHLFKNSRRYPTFLRYVIEQTLEGNPDSLKERTLGVEIFGREPSYDTTGDSIVRVAAAEVRKRIAQYYQEDGHEDELRIELPTGSYVPQFRFPRAAEASRISETKVEEPAVDPVIPIEANPAVLLHASSPFFRRIAASAAFALIAIALAVLGIYRAGLLAAKRNTLAPLLSEGESVLFCIGNPDVAQNQPGEDGAKAAKELGQPTANNTLIPLADAVTLSRLQSFLDQQKMQHHVQLARETTLNELRSGPDILIGAFDNPWTIRLAGKLRFRFVGTDQSQGSIVDSKGNQNMHWSVDFHVPYSDRTQDYAIVASVHDDTLDRPILIAAGIGPNGTMAAGEFLSSKKDMAQLAQKAPAHWGGNNVEVVLATQVIEGNAGPPQIVATEFW